MSADAVPAVPVGADDYQLIQPPAQLDPRLLVALARLVMDGDVTTRPHTAALMALTAGAWVADHFLADRVGPVSVLSPVVASPGADQPEAATLLHAAACITDHSEPVEGLPPGVQGALPPVNWAKFILVVATILQQLAPLLGTMQ